jgi:hypothetical protein
VGLSLRMLCSFLLCMWWGFWGKQLLAVSF